MLDVIHNRLGQDQSTGTGFIADFVAVLRNALRIDAPAIFQNNGIGKCSPRSRQESGCAHPSRPTCTPPVHFSNVLPSVGTGWATLLLHVLSDYTASMISRALLFFNLTWLLFANRAQQAPPRDPGEILALLNRAQPDPAATYKIQPGRRIELRRGEAKLLLEDGELAFFIPVTGKITGAVFSGRGHILATPRDSVEKQQLAYFLGVPVVDQDFTSAYLRFSEDTAQELLRELQSAKAVAQTDAAFTELWQPVVQLRNPAHSLRLFYESLSETSHPYFAASLSGVQTGPFDFFYDQMRDEPQMFGQARKTNTGEYYDIWTSSSPSRASTIPLAFRVLQYRIDATIHQDNSISGEAVIHFETRTPGERLIGFEFSRFLRVESATLGGETLFTYPNEATTSEERRVRGTDALYLVLPRAPKKG